MLATQEKLGSSLPETLLALMERHPDLVVTSFGPEHGAEAFAGLFPSRHHKVSPPRANLVEFAAGFTTRGLRPVVIGFSWDQTEILCAKPAPVILLGSDSFRDIAMMRAIPDMTVVIPGDACEFRCALEEALVHSGPVYIRVWTGSQPLRFQEPFPEFKIGKSRKLRDGVHLTIAACGAATAIATEAADRLAGDGLSADLLEIPTIKPIDADALIGSARKTGSVLTVEEHSISGGLGSAVAETLCRFFPTSMQMIAAEHGPVSEEKIARTARLMAMSFESA